MAHVRATLEFVVEYGRALTVAAGVVGLVAVVAVAVQDGLGEVVRALPLAGVVVLLGLGAVLAPAVEVSDGGVAGAQRRCAPRTCPGPPTAADRAVVARSCTPPTAT